MDNETRQSLTVIQNSLDGITAAIEEQLTLGDFDILLFMVALTAKGGSANVNAETIYNQARELSLCYDAMLVYGFPPEFDDSLADGGAEK